MELDYLIIFFVAVVAGSVCLFLWWFFRKSDGVSTDMTISPPGLFFKFIPNYIYKCPKCQQEMPAWIVEYFSKEKRKNFEALDNFVVENASISHINCKKNALTEGTTCIVCEKEMGRRAICEACNEQIEKEAASE